MSHKSLQSPDCPSCRPLDGGKDPHQRQTIRNGASFERFNATNGLDVTNSQGGDKAEASDFGEKVAFNQCNLNIRMYAHVMLAAIAAITLL